MDHLTKLADWCDTLYALRPYRNMLAAVYQELQLTRAGFTLLDVGCATGQLLQVLHESDTKPVVSAGMEHIPVLLARAKERLGDQMMGAAWPPFEPDGAGVRFTPDTWCRVVCLDLINSVHDPTKLLQEMYNVLKPQHLLLLTTRIPGVSFGKVLQAHCQSKRPDAYWNQFELSTQQAHTLIHEAVSDQEIATGLIQLHQQFNAMDIRNRHQTLKSEELVQLVTSAGFSIQNRTEILAGYHIMITARKEQP